MTPSSAKAKGRGFQQTIRDRIVQSAEIHPDDVMSRGMGQAGTDIYLSVAARHNFPFAVECKNVERLNIWQAIQQTEINAGKEGLTPMLAFRRNRQRPYIAIPADEFFKIWSRYLILQGNAKPSTEGPAKTTSVRHST